MSDEVLGSKAAHEGGATPTAAPVNNKKWYKAGSAADERLKGIHKGRIDQMLYQDSSKHLLSKMDATKNIVAPISSITKGIEKAVPPPLLWLAENAMFDAIPGSRVMWTGLNMLF